MKKLLPFSIAALLAGATPAYVHAQAITENFNNPQGIFSSGWAQQNLSTTIGTLPNWFTGNTTVFIANSSPDTSYIGANYNATSGAGDISMWLFAPTRTFNNGDVVSFYTRTVDAPSYPDRLEFRLSTNGSSVDAGTTSSSVGDFTTLLLSVNPSLTTSGYPSTWTQYTFTITGLSGPTSGRVAFRYYVTNGGPSGSNSDYIGIDNFQYSPAGLPDVSVNNYDEEYTIIPLAQVTPFALTDTITNLGTAVANNTMLTVNVYQDPNYTTPVQTTTSSTSSLAAGSSAAFSAGSFTPTSTGFYLYEFISSCTNNTVNSGDTTYYGILVDDSIYARDDGNVSGALGIGAGNGGYLGESFEIVTPTHLSSVTSYYTAGYTGQPYAAVIWNTVAGVPNAIIGSTDTMLYPNDSALLSTVNIHGGPLTLMPGNYVVTVVEFDSTVQIGLCNTIFTTGTTWVNWPTSPAGGWANNEFFGSSFAKPYVIRPNFNCNTSMTQSVTLCYGQTLTVGSSTYNASGTYMDTLTNASGCDSVITTNLNVNPQIDTSVTINGFTITANQAAATYQWIDCNAGGSPIAGETNSSYTPAANGSYAVVITMGSCSDTSSCVTITGDISSAAPRVISVYPNPNAGDFVITSVVAGDYVITNELGQEVARFTLNAQNNYRASMTNLTPGVYIITGYSGSDIVKQRIVVSGK